MPIQVEKTANLEHFEEPFIGMWRDRDDMRDSSDWVRKTRNSEWKIDASRGIHEASECLDKTTDSSAN